MGGDCGVPVSLCHSWTPENGPIFFIFSSMFCWAGNRGNPESTRSKILGIGGADVTSRCSANDVLPVFADEIKMVMLVSENHWMATFQTHPVFLATLATVAKIPGPSPNPMLPSSFQSFLPVCQLPQLAPQPAAHLQLYIYIYNLYY